MTVLTKFISLAVASLAASTELGSPEVNLRSISLAPRRSESSPQAARKSVPRYRRIDQSAPGIDTASHALAGCYTLFPQPVRHVQAADSVVAEYNQCRFVRLGFQLLQAGWDVPHRDQCGAFDARDGKFLRLANVKQHQRFSGVDSALDVFRAGFDWEDRFAHESRIAQWKIASPTRSKAGRPRSVACWRTCEWSVICGLAAMGALLARMRTRRRGATIRSG